MKKRFVELIEGFCRLSGTDQSAHIAGGGSVVVNDVVMLLAHKEQLDPALLYVRCHFGGIDDMPECRRTAACRALLEANLDLYDGSGPAFSLSAHTGHVIFSVSYPLATLRPADLREILAALSDAALEWRSGHFLAPLPAHRHRQLSGWTENAATVIRKGDQ